MQIHRMMADSPYYKTDDEDDEGAPTSGRHSGHQTELNKFMAFNANL